MGYNLITCRANGRKPVAQLQMKIVKREKGASLQRQEKCFSKREKYKWRAPVNIV